MYDARPPLLAHCVIIFVEFLRINIFYHYYKLISLCIVYNILFPIDLMLIVILLVLSSKLSILNIILQYPLIMLYYYALCNLYVSKL